MPTLPAIMTTIHPITPDSEIPFPCWLWHHGFGKWQYHKYSPTVLWGVPMSVFTHWHPDQPNAPTDKPQTGSDAPKEPERCQPARDLCAEAALEITTLKEPIQPYEVAAIIRRVAAGHYEEEIERLKAWKAAREAADLASTSVVQIPHTVEMGAGGAESREARNNRLIGDVAEALLKEQELDALRARAEKAEAERDKLVRFYDEIVREIGHDRIVTEHRQRGELLRQEAQRRKDAESQLAAALKAKEEAEAYLSSRKLVEVRPGTFAAVDAHVKTYIEELRESSTAAQQKLKENGL